LHGNFLVTIRSKSAIPVRRVKGLARLFPGRLKHRVMNVLDLIKATLACGISAFLIYSFPVIGQIVIIALLTLLWLSYAHRTLAYLRRR